MGDRPSEDALSHSPGARGAAFRRDRRREAPAAEGGTDTVRRLRGTMPLSAPCLGLVSCFKTAIADSGEYLPAHSGGPRTHWFGGFGLGRGHYHCGLRRRRRDRTRRCRAACALPSGPGRRRTGTPKPATSPSGAGTSRTPSVLASRLGRYEGVRLGHFTATPTVDPNRASRPRRDRAYRRGIFRTAGGLSVA